MTDEAVMARVQADDRGAFAELYDRHGARAYRVAFAVCRERTRAEDAVQEGFLSMWRSRSKYRSEAGTFQSWSMRIVHNRAIDSFRRAAKPGEQVARIEEKDPAPDLLATSPPDEVIAIAERDELGSFLSALPPKQTEVIVLAFYGGLSHSEIAAHLDLSSGTVKGRMRLGLEKMRDAMAVSNR